MDTLTVSAVKDTLILSQDIVASLRRAVEHLRTQTDNPTLIDDFDAAHQRVEALERILARARRHLVEQP